MRCRHAPQTPFLTFPDDELAPLKLKRTNLPKKPRRYFLPGLVACIILRLEIFHRVTVDLQCSKPGIEVSLLSCPLSVVVVCAGSLTCDRRPSCHCWFSHTNSCPAAGHGQVLVMARRRTMTISA